MCVHCPINNVFGPIWFTDGLWTDSEKKKYFDTLPESGRGCWYWSIRSRRCWCQVTIMRRIGGSRLHYKYIHSSELYHTSYIINSAHFMIKCTRYIYMNTQTPLDVWHSIKFRCAEDGWGNTPVQLEYIRIHQFYGIHGNTPVYYRIHQGHSTGKILYATWMHTTIFVWFPFYNLQTSKKILKEGQRGCIKKKILIFLINIH